MIVTGEKPVKTGNARAVVVSVHASVRETLSVRTVRGKRLVVVVSVLLVVQVVNQTQTVHEGNNAKMVSASLLGVAGPMQTVHEGNNARMVSVEAPINALAFALPARSVRTVREKRPVVVVNVWQVTRAVKPTVTVCEMKLVRTVNAKRVAASRTVIVCGVRLARAVNARAVVVSRIAIAKQGKSVLLENARPPSAHPMQIVRRGRHAKTVLV